MLAPISWRVPPRHYGPWEQFVSLLTEGLVARGVDVTLFATACGQPERHKRRDGTRKHEAPRTNQSIFRASSSTSASAIASGSAAS